MAIKTIKPISHPQILVISRQTHYFCFFQESASQSGFPLPTFLQQVASKLGGTFVALREGHLNALWSFPAHCGIPGEHLLLPGLTSARANVCRH